MKLDLFENQYKPSNMIKIFFADIVCFLLVAIVSIGFCYSYFSDGVNIKGSTTTAMMVIDYRNDNNVSVDNIYAQVNGKTASTLSNIKVCPGDTVNIKGKAVNANEDNSLITDVDVYLLAKLIIESKDASGNIIDTETIWYNVGEATAVPLYVERGLFQIGASVLAADSSQNINIQYVIEGERYNNDYSTIAMTLELHSHQKDYLNLAEDYDNYSAVTTNVTINQATKSVTYSKESIYATHAMVGRKRDVWEDSDATVTGLTLDSLEKDSSDNSGNTYLINSCQDWMIIRATATSANAYHEGKTFKFNAYLDFNNTDIPKTISQLEGNLNGQGYTICNWYSTQTGIGLIDIMYGHIINLGIDSLQINYNSSSFSVGGMVARLYYGTIDNCFVIGASNYDSDVIYDLNITGTSGSVGGLVGYLYGDGGTEISGAIKNSYALLNIHKIGSTYLSSQYVGGIVGTQYPAKTLIENCYYQGNITNENDSTDTDGSKVLIKNGLMSAHNFYGSQYNCFGLTNEISNSDYYITGYNNNRTDVKNSAYILGNFETVTAATKVGQEQTSKNITIKTFRSSGLMRDAFGWDTSIWGTDVYTGNNSFVVLRVFYNY
ncbi:MAG: hypothetical protein J6Q15_01835 [Clostridia bacterium]|nr:hypothetical protein [Clostridia bacterium]